MMRDLTFRIKSKDHSEWFRFTIGEKLPNGDVFTLGQFTGCRDKHDVAIYEGDIVKKRGKDGSFHMMPVRFNNGRFECWYKPENRWVICDYSYSLVDSNIEIVGNIYDNPELVAR